MRGKGRFFIIYALLIMCALLVSGRTERAIELQNPLSQVPKKLGEWRSTSEYKFDEEVLAVLRPSAYLARRYEGRGPGGQVVYLGYHGGGPEAGQIHSPRHCLPGSGWNPVQGGAKLVTIPGTKTRVVSALYRKDDQQQLFLYWYDVRGEAVTNEYLLKLRLLQNAIKNRRKDATFVRLSALVWKDPESSLNNLLDLAGQLKPHLDRVLPR